MKVLAAIPTFHCEKQIGRVLAGFDKNLIQRVSKVIIIDNKSSDATLDNAINEAQSFPPGKIEILQNNQNYGLGGSQKLAFIYALKNGYDWLAVLHGDDQAKAADLHSLLKVAEQNGDLAAVFGARFAWNSTRVGYSKFRTAGNFGLNLVYSLITSRLIFDLGSGLNLFNLRHFSDRYFMNFNNNFIFNQEMLLDLCRRRSPFQFVPIHWYETDQVSNAKTIWTGWLTLKSAIQWKLGRWPIDPSQLRTDFGFTKIFGNDPTYV